MSYEEEKQDRKIEQLEAEIERMRADLQSCGAYVGIGAGEGDPPIPERVRRTVNRLNGSVGHYEQKLIVEDARIAELEDALVEEKTRGDLYCEHLLDWDDYDYKAYTWPKDAIPGYKHFSEADIAEFRENARQQLQTEGKIGPDATQHDHTAEFFRPNESPAKSWKITDERKAAILHCKRMLTFLKEDDAPCYDVEKITKDESVLVAMLKEAEQE